MRRKRKFVLWGAAFTTLLALGSVTAAITAGAAPFGAQATTTIVTTITTTTPDSSSSSSTGSSTESSTGTTGTTTTTSLSGGGGAAGAGNAPAATPAKANPNFTG